jgi:PAS domain S-box-containing protein
MSANQTRQKKRPSYPSAARQGFGLLLIALVIGAIEAFEATYGVLDSPGGLLLISVIFVSYWSGLRTGMIAAAIAYCYLLVEYSTAGALFHYTPRNLNRIINTAILLPGLAALVGSIQGRLRNAGIREFDAQAKADAEATQRQITQSELKSMDELYGLVVASAMDAIIAMREDGRITLWNPNAETVFGWKSEEVVGKLLADTVVPPGHREAHIRGLKRFIETGQQNLFGKRLELSALSKDGREFPIELTIVPHKTDEGYIFIGFVRDLTEQRKLNERLRQAQKMEAIGTLAGGIAHDFNNILTAVSGNLMLVRADIPSEDSTQESLSEIEKAVLRATYLVRQILTFSRARDADPEILDLPDTLREAIKLLQATIPATMEIEAHFEPDLPPIFADATDIHQIILNLGINAYQAMSGSSGKFEVQVNSMTLDETTADSLLSVTPGRYVRISVGDTGCGMDSHTLQRVFEPFFTTKALGEGTGLGLSVVYGIVERHHGAITIYSEPTKGTVFHIYFPVADGAVEKEEAKTSETWSGDGERILYVDDDEALVFMMTRMLRRLNYQVVGYQHPSEALEAFKSNPSAFDLVITDMSMPHMDGPALVQELHSIRPDLPIVMVTGYIRPNDMDQAHRLGVKELILKPNTVVEMSEVLHRILSELRDKETSGSSSA